MAIAARTSGILAKWTLYLCIKLYKWVVVVVVFGFFFLLFNTVYSFGIFLYGFLHIQFQKKRVPLAAAWLEVSTCSWALAVTVICIKSFSVFVELIL